MRTARTAAAALLLAALPGCRTAHDPSLIVASGHVEATEVRLSSKVGGTLISYPLEEGARLEPGREVARIDPVDITLALKAAHAERDTADAELRLRLAGARVEDIAEAEAMVRRAEADLEGAEKELARMQGLLDAGSGTVRARDDAKTRRDLAAAALAAARERLKKLQAGSRQEEIDAARARVAAAEARIAQLTQQLGDSIIVSPAAGILTEKLAERGEFVSPGSPLAVITDISGAWLTVYVPETDLGRIRLGQEADVTTDDGQRRSGRITFIDSRAEFTPKNVQTRDERVKLVYRVKIALDNADGLFKPGMPAEARLRRVSEDS